GCAAVRVRSLFGDDLIVVAVIRRTALVGLVALLRRPREQLTERALLVALRDRPVKPVLLAGIADEALGIDARARTGAVLFGVFILGVDIGKTNPDGVELVAADPPVENFATTLLGIEGPLPGLADQRDRKRIVIVADHQDGFAVAVRRDLVLGVVGFQKTLTDRVVGNLVAGRDDVVAIGTENGKLGVLIVSADGADERRGRFVRRLVALLCFDGGCGRQQRDRAGYHHSRGARPERAVRTSEQTDGSHDILRSCQCSAVRLLERRAAAASR